MNKYSSSFTFIIWLIYIAAPSRVNSACDAEPPTIEGASSVVVIENSFVVYTCENNVQFSSGDTAIPSKCINNEWTTISAVCDSTEVQGCNGSPTDPEDTEPINIEGDTSSKFVAYNCINDKHWLSGEAARITQCRKGSWTEVWDICDTGCPVPRDCADVKDLGLNDTGLYMVIPSGVADGTVRKVFCDMDNGAFGHSWMQIFVQKKEEASFNNEAYINGYGDVEKHDSNEKYFAGLNLLKEISQDFEDRDPGNVMQIEFLDKDKNALHYTTYGNFTVGSDPTYSLKSLGKYHGMGGDGLCPHVNTDFTFEVDDTAEAPEWWGVNKDTWEDEKNVFDSFLTNNLIWEPLEDKMGDVDHVTIKIRPIFRDRETQCPPMVGWEMEWDKTITEAWIPNNRSEGVVIKWKCHGEIFFAHVDETERLSEGEITCIKDEASGELKWDRQLTLPCMIKCPDGFSLTDDAMKCLKGITAEKATVLKASQMCMADTGSTLAVIDEISDLEKLENGKTYFVNHMRRGHDQTDFVFPIPSFLNCSDGDWPCNYTEEACTIVSMDKEYWLVPCDEPHEFLCQLPAKCPDGYWASKGACYHVLAEQTSLEAALRTCTGNGSGLAYPTSWDHVEGLISLLNETVISKSDDPSQEFHFYLGLNSMKGPNFTYGDMFKMESTFVDDHLTPDSDKHYRVLWIQGQEKKFLPVDYDFTQSGMFAVCQNPGIVGCEEPSDSPENTERIWNSELEEGTELEYKCLPGSFFNGSSTSQKLKCRGMLGGWALQDLDKLHPCERTPVCENSKIEVKSNAIGNASTDESWYYMGNITFECPDGMAFEDGNVSIVAECKQLEDQSFAFQPSEIAECNVCMGEITLENSDTSWSNTSVFTIGMNITLTCEDGYQYTMGEAEQQVPCTEWGWDKSNVKECYRACTEVLPEAEGFVQDINITSSSIGTEIMYECKEGYHFVLTEESPEPTAQVTVTCNENGTWVYSRGNASHIECVKICSEEPPKTPEFASSSWNNYSREINVSITYTCDAGRLFGDLSYEMEITCGEESKWTPAVAAAMFTCTKACTEDLPKVGENVQEPNVTSKSEGIVLQYTCEDGLYFIPTENNPGLLSEIELTCSSNGSWVHSRGDDPFNCTQLCSEDPPEVPGMGDSDWNNASRAEGDEIIYTCDAGYNFENMSDTWTISCNGTGWFPMSERPFDCYRVCEEDPPTGGEMVKPFNVTSTLSGDTITYECQSGYYLPVTEPFADPAMKVEVKCNDTGIWENSQRTATIDCIQMCVDNPPDVPTNGNSSWDGMNREPDHTITYTCNEDYKFGDFNDSWDVTCNGSHWNYVASEDFVCVEVCMSDPPTLEKTTTENWPSMHGVVDDVVEYHCDNGTANKDGTETISVTCTGKTGWTNDTKDFLCEPSCMSEPPPPSDGATSTFTGDRRIGTNVTYECTGGQFSQRYVQTLKSVCEEGGKWTLTEIPQCFSKDDMEGYDGPPNPEKVDAYYSYTADYFDSNLDKGYTTTDGSPVNYETVPGPIGFGEAKRLESEDDQCLVKEQYASFAKLCLLTPSKCHEADEEEEEKGLSFSIWERHYVHDNTLTSADCEASEEEYQYIISTGGDTKGHPGIAIAHRGHCLMALVSTGKKYWMVEVLGVLVSNVWNNIGVTWNENDGLKLFVNVNTLAATVQLPEEAESAKYSLEPPTLMIGCHKDNDNREFRGFNNGDVDEVAMWQKALANETDFPEILKFLGGFKEDMDDISAEDMNEILKRASFKNPEVFDNLISLMNSVSKKEKPTESAPTSSTATDGTPTSPTDGNSTGNGTTDSDEVMDISGLKMTVDNTMLFMNTSRLPETIDPDQLNTFMRVAEPMDNVLKKENCRAWKKLQRTSDDYSAADLIETFSEYQKEIMRRTAFPNGTKEFCFVSNTKNILNQNCKTTVEVMKKKEINSYPAYKHPSLKKRRATDFQGVYDRAGVPTIAYQDSRCDERGVGSTITIYFSASCFVKRAYKFNLYPDKRIKIDSNIMTFNVVVDPVYRKSGQIDTSEPLCEPDPEYLRRMPIFANLEHRAKMFQLRKLQFHEDEIFSNIDTRKCVHWNPELDNYTGAWDTSNCKIKKSIDEFTKCSCNDFGTFAIIAQKSEPIEVEEDPEWLPIPKYALYVVSAIAVFLYIIIVLLSGELKDQLHLIGLNLAVAILVGSLVMNATDWENIRESRHMCLAFGTLIHFFYGGAGVWTLALGHACFRCIISGEVGGKLTSYMLVSWGVTLVLIGVPYVGFLHDLANDPRCFIGWINEVKYTFFIPQVSCMGVGIFYSITVLCNLSRPALREKNLVKDYGSFCTGSSILILIMALTWAVGFVAYIRFETTEEQNFYPYFQIINAVSGLFLFLCIGLGSNRFRNSIVGKFKNKKDNYDENDDTQNLMINDEDHPDNYDAGNHQNNMDNHQNKQGFEDHL